MTLQHNLNAVQDPYRAVSLVLLVAAILGMWAAFVGGIKLTNPAMLVSGSPRAATTVIRAAHFIWSPQRTAAAGHGTALGRTPQIPRQRKPFVGIL